MFIILDVYTLVWFQVEYCDSCACEKTSTRGTTLSLGGELAMLYFLVLLVVGRVVLGVLSFWFRCRYPKESEERPRPAPTPPTAIWRRGEALLVAVVLVLLCGVVE